MQQAVRTALDESAGSRFDVRANVYTLVAITGVVLYWRGVWSLWCVRAGGIIQYRRAAEHARPCHMMKAQLRMPDEGSCIMHM